MATLRPLMPLPSAVAWDSDRGGESRKKILPVRLRRVKRSDLLPTSVVGTKHKTGPISRNVVRMMSDGGKGVATEPQTEKKIAKLYVTKEQTVPLPTFSDPSGNPLHLSVFLREPEGKQCMLNTKALRRYENVDDNLFRCYLPKIEFLSFEVAPILDLLVAADEESCRVDMLSCKFEGSDVFRGQNERFSASLKNNLTWSTQQDGEQYLDVRLDLNVALEVYTLPFTMLPISAVESPGTLILQLLVDRLLPLFLDQLFNDYRAWAQGRIPSVDDEQIAHK